MTSTRRDSGLIQIGWMTRLVAVLAVVGVLGFDGFAVMSARIKGEDDAQNAADAASAEWQLTHNINAAYQAAVTSVASHDEKILTRGFTIDADNTVHLLLRRSASTLVFQRIGPMRHFTVETVHGDQNHNPV